MFEASAWSYIIFGFALGIISTLFVINVVKKEPLHIGILILYALSVAFVTFLYSTAASGGLLEEWQLLEFPSLADKGVKVLEIGYVQTQSGNIYHWTNPYSRLDGQWEKVDEIKIDPEFPIFPNCKGGSLSFLPIKRKDFTDYKEACIYWGPGLSKTAYAIDGEGRVYLWYHGVGEYGGIVPIIYSISGGMYGCGFGLLLILILAISKFIYRKLRPQH